MDKVFLRGVKAETLVGVYDWERERVQALLLDLDIGVSEKATLSDDIGETVYHGDVCEAMRISLREQDFLLLEVLTEHVADLILRDFGTLWVWAKIVKPDILPDVKEAGVEIEHGAPRQIFRRLHGDIYQIGTKNKMDLKETKVGSEPIYEGSLVSISRDTVRLANGNESKRVITRHPGAANVLAETESGEIMLARQWRYAMGEAVLELPTGKLDVAGEDPAERALHELTGETPYTADSVKLLHTPYTAVGFYDEKMYLYQAQGVRLGSTLSNDEDEITETVLMNHEAVKAVPENDEIRDAKILVELQYWLMHTK